MFHLTRQERLVLIFLAFVFWIGATLQYLGKRYPAIAEKLHFLKTTLPQKHGKP